MVHVQLLDTAVFDAEGLHRDFGLKRTAIRTAMRRGLLKGSRRAGRVWFTGTAVRAWLFGDNPTEARPAAVVGGNGAAHGDAEPVRGAARRRRRQ